MACLDGNFARRQAINSCNGKRYKRSRPTSKCFKNCLSKLTQQIKRRTNQLKQANDNARQQLAELEAICATAPIGLYFIDTNLRYLRVNEHLAKVNGVSLKEHIGRTVSDVLPELAAKLEPVYYQAIASGELILNLEISGTNIAEPAAEAEEANCLKDDFLAVLSHELRSPLNPILGWTRLLQTRKLDETKVFKALTTIEHNAKLQAQLVEDLLDISQIVRGKLSLNATPVDLNFVITSALETVRLAAEAKSIQIQVIPNPNINLVYGDVGRLQQVVWNLLSNAVKFTLAQGQVEVGLAQIDNEAQMQVIDTGKGIHAQFLPYIFEYFRQEDSSTTRKFGGLGLGLAIARQIV